MKLKFALTALVTLFTLSLSIDARELATGKPVKLFICSGQSNMGGGGGAKAYNEAMPEANLPRNDIWFWHSNTVGKGSEGWEALGSGQSGPETPFAVEMAEAFPDHTIAILKVSKGASSISYWLPGEATKYNSRAGWKHLEKLIPAALADLREKEAAGVIPSFEMAGFVWMQGEGDANGVRQGPGHYLGNLRELVQHVNTLAGTENLPTVIGRISIQISPASVRPTGKVRVSKSEGGGLPDDADFVNDGQLRGPIWFVSELEAVRGDQMQFTEEYPAAAWVDIDDLPLRDPYHYAPAEYATMGQRFAGAMQALLAEAPAQQGVTIYAGEKSQNIAILKWADISSVEGGRRRAHSYRINFDIPSTHLW